MINSPLPGPLPPKKEGEKGEKVRVKGGESEGEKKGKEGILAEGGLGLDNICMVIACHPIQKISMSILI